MDSLDREIAGENDTILSGDSVKDQFNLEDSALNNIMDKALKTELWEIVKDNTTPEENKVLQYRFKQALSLDATGQIIGKSRDMARNIESKALRKMRRPKVTRMLKDKFEINFATAYKGSLSSFNYTWTSSTESVAMKNYEIRCLDRFV